MEMIGRVNVVFVLLLNLQGCLSAVTVEVFPQEAIVIPGQNASFLCRVSSQLQYCRIQIPGLTPMNLNKNIQPTGGFSYYGEGLDKGQCGVTINSVEDKYNGIVRCFLGLPSEVQEPSGAFLLTVARTPKPAQLFLRGGTDNTQQYKVNDVLTASCRVADARPVANISWFLDNVRLEEGLEMSRVEERDNLFTRTQNLTRTLRAIDHGKVLKCVGNHPAYPEGYSAAEALLIVQYPPQPLPNPIDKFGFAIGKLGVISLEIQANPAPRLEWTVRDETITQGSTDRSGRIEAGTVTDLGGGIYEATLRIASITKQDTETQFRLTAYNTLGKQDYYVQISTEPEPEGIELGVGAIIGIVAAILIAILIVFVIIFARVTGRWCFSDGTRVIDYTSGESGADQQSTPPDGIDNPHHQASQEYINGNDLQIKKKEEKINTPV